MALLNETVRNQLRPMLEGLPRDVELHLYRGPDAEAGDLMAALLSEMVEVGPRLRLVEVAQAPEVEPGRQSAAQLEGPVLSVAAAGEPDSRVRFLGITGGHEFGALIAAIQHAAAGSAELKPKSVESLSGLGHRVHIQVFTTPT